MPRKKTRSQVVKLLDKVFSEYIRRRFAKNEIAECFTCGKKDHWKKLQCGHFQSRKHYATRWDEINCQVQCSACNVFRYGEQYKYSLWLGQEKAEQLYMLSKKTLKLMEYDLLDLINIYEEKVKVLKKGLN